MPQLKLSVFLKKLFSGSLNVNQAFNYLIIDLFEIMSIQSCEYKYQIFTLLCIHFVEALIIFD